MAFTLQAYQQKRPYLFHLTRLENFSRILRTRQLESASHILNLAGQPNIALLHRANDLIVTIDGQDVIVRDQAPLHIGNVKFTGDWDGDKLIKEINKRIFFWSGSIRGPVANAQRHFDRYKKDKPIVLRIRFDELVQVNPAKQPYFCKYNSGSPRYTNGRASPRGPETFSPGIDCTFAPTEVIEVTFLHSITLPETTESAATYAGPWTPAFL
jgi:hypothetical protein